MTMKTTVDPSRLRYLCYRCYRCGRLLTKGEILGKWAKAEQDPTVVHSALCRCGSRHISPTNPSLWEELTKPRVWRLWWDYVLVPWLRTGKKAEAACR
jgi:hypothetical protein